MFKNKIVYYLFLNSAFANLYKEVEYDKKMEYPNPGKMRFGSFLKCVCLFIFLGVFL